MAFNLLIPNFTVNAALRGNSQLTLKQQAFLGATTYNNLTIGEGRGNRVFLNANVYWAMAKFYLGGKGKQEIGFSAQIKSEGTAFYTDETAALPNGSGSFNKQQYINLFNDNFKSQSYHQLSLTYRSTIDSYWSWGVKASALSGVLYARGRVDQSSVTFSNPDNASIYILGEYRTNTDPGSVQNDQLYKIFKNPGASFGLNAAYHSETGYKFQFNLKDVGFIRWNNQSNIYTLNGTAFVRNISGPNGGNRAYDAIDSLAQRNGVKKGFTTTTDGRFEVSVTHSYWLDWEKEYQYKPVAIVSTPLFYKGISAAVVNNFQYHNHTVGVITSYDNIGHLNLGGQYMYKAPNLEFFIGCEQLYPGYSIALAALGSNSARNKTTPTAAAGFFLGMAFKFGKNLESMHNSSDIPMGN
nr:DUF5723 family protein [Mucilaginibacter straminoryzae]